MSATINELLLDRKQIVQRIIGNTKIPKFVKIKQSFNNNVIFDISSAIRAELATNEIQKTLRPGMSIAITVGSRGIAHIDLISKTVITFLKEKGCKPFIIPAMGSHGGATPEGQVEMLDSFGITEVSMQVPIISSMKTEIIGYAPGKKPIYLSSDALKADGIVVIGRVKPHTAFRGPYESGLIKMMVIGLGKQQGAESCHYEGFGNMATNLENFADCILEKTNILFGLAIIENAYDETCMIKALPKNRIKQEEPALLLKAKELMPKILFDDFDILIIDQIGKNFSGDGADPNISGSFSTPYATGGPKYQRYVILDLSNDTHGNASGIGMADFTTKRAVCKMDFDASYPNALTSRVVSGVKLPMVLNSDKLAIQAAIFCLVSVDHDHPKIVRLANTSHIDEIYISEALIPQAKTHDAIKFLGDLQEVFFDENGNIPELEG